MFVFLIFITTGTGLKSVSLSALPIAVTQQAQLIRPSQSMDLLTAGPAAGLGFGPSVVGVKKKTVRVQPLTQAILESLAQSSTPQQNSRTAGDGDSDAGECLADALPAGISAVYKSNSGAAEPVVQTPPSGAGTSRSAKGGRSASRNAGIRGSWDGSGSDGLDRGSVYSRSGAKLPVLDVSGAAGAMGGGVPSADDKRSSRSGGGASAGTGGRNPRVASPQSVRSDDLMLSSRPHTSGSDWA